MPRRLLLFGAIPLAIIGAALVFLVIQGSEQLTEGDCLVDREPINVLPLDVAAAKDGGAILESFVPAPVGDEVEPGHADAKLEMQTAPRTIRYPVAALGDCILLQQVSFDEATQRSFLELAVWNPDAGNEPVMVPGYRIFEENEWQSRIESAAGEWIVEMRIAPPTSPSAAERSQDEIVLIHYQTGETRTIRRSAAGALIGGVQSSGRFVVWAEADEASDGRRFQRIVVHDPVDAQTTTVVEQQFEPQHFTFGIPHMNGDTLAWTDRRESAARDLYVGNIRLGTVTRYEMKSGQYSEVEGISQDGDFVFTSAATTQFSTNLLTKESSLYAHAGNADAGDAHAAFSNVEGDSASRTTDGGLYSLREGKTRFLGEQAGRRPIVVGSWDKWFVWMAPPDVSQEAAVETIPVGPLYFKVIQ